MGRSFYLITHKNGMIYAEILDPETGVHITTRSTGTKSREEAAFIVGQWLREGMIALDPTEGLLKFSGKGKKRGVLTPRKRRRYLRLNGRIKGPISGICCPLQPGSGPGRF
jgi:hypothetical protein